MFPMRTSLSERARAGLMSVEPPSVSQGGGAMVGLVVADCWLVGAITNNSESSLVDSNNCHFWWLRQSLVQAISCKHFPSQEVLLWAVLARACAAYSSTLATQVRVTCWGTYTYMHICTKSIQIYFGIFFDFILVLLSFHCSHTVPIFFRNFPYFSCHFIHFKSLSFWHGTVNFCFHLSACVPACHAESNCIICNVRVHLGTLSRVEAGGGNRVYVGWDTYSHFPSSVFWQSLRRWEPIVSFPSLYY